MSVFRWCWCLCLYILDFSGSEYRIEAFPDTDTDKVILIGPKINIKPFDLQAKYQYTKICFLSRTPGCFDQKTFGSQIPVSLDQKISGGVKIV